MIKRPPSARDKRKDRQVAESEKSELKRGLDLTIDRSINSVTAKIEALLQKNGQLFDPKCGTVRIRTPAEGN